MAWDLRRALLKKEEKESARLADFDYRLRARTMRLLAARLDAALDPAALAARTARSNDDDLLAELTEAYPGVDMSAAFEACRSEARRQLIEEIGDPSPHRLA